MTGMMNWRWSVQPMPSLQSIRLGPRHLRAGGSILFPIDTFCRVR